MPKQTIPAVTLASPHLAHGKPQFYSVHIVFWGVAEVLYWISVHALALGGAAPQTTEINKNYHSGSLQTALLIFSSFLQECYIPLQDHTSVASNVFPPPAFWSCLCSFKPSHMKYTHPHAPAKTLPANQVCPEVSFLRKIFPDLAHCIHGKPSPPLITDAHSQGQ